jgi:hypothetical protein
MAQMLRASDGGRSASASGPQQASTPESAAAS